MTIAVLVLYGIMFQYHFINKKEFEMEIWSKRYHVELSRNLSYVKSNISAKQILYVRVLHNINATWKRPPFLNMFSKNIAFTSWKNLICTYTQSLRVKEAFLLPFTLQIYFETCCSFFVKFLQWIKKARDL